MIASSKLKEGNTGEDNIKIGSMMLMNFKEC